MKFRNIFEIYPTFRNIFLPTEEASVLRGSSSPSNTPSKRSKFSENFDFQVAEQAGVEADIVFNITFIVFSISFIVFRGLLKEEKQASAVMSIYLHIKKYPGSHTQNYGMYESRKHCGL